MQFGSIQRLAPRWTISPWPKQMPGAWFASARSPPASWRRSITTVFARPGSRRTLPTVARWSMRRPWPRTRVRAPPSSTTGRRNGLPKMRWRGYGCDADFDLNVIKEIELAHAEKLTDDDAFMNQRQLDYFRQK